MCLCVSATHDYMCSSNQAYRMCFCALKLLSTGDFISCNVFVHQNQTWFHERKTKNSHSTRITLQKKTKYYFENFEIQPLNQMEIYQPPSHPETYSKCFTNGKENQGSEKNTPLQIIPNRIVGLSWVLFSNFNVYARNCLSKVINVLCVRFRFTFSP